MKKSIAIAALALMSAGQVQAKAFNSEGVATGQANDKVIEFADDHLVISTNATYSTFTMADTTNPLSQAKGSCFGTLEVRKGAVEGNGVCVLDGLDGDRVLLGWIARRIDPQGRIIGYWTVNAGTGIWQQASGGGTFMTSTNPANGTATNVLRGAVTLR